MIMKRLTAVLLTFALLLALTACGAGSSPASASSAAAEASGSAAEETAAPVEEAVAEAAEEEASAEDSALEAEEPEETAAEPYVYDLPLTDEPLSFSLFAMTAAPFITPYLGEGQSYNTAESTRYLEELTGVRIDYHEVDMFSYAEQLSLMVVSGDCTDMITSMSYYTGGCSKAYEEDVILDLTDYVLNDMPVYKAAIEERDLEKNLMNDKGQYLDIKTINSDLIIGRGCILRKDYLDQLGLGLPETYDELHEAGKAIQSQFDCKYVFFFTSSLNPDIAFSDGFDLPGFDATGSGTSFYQIDGKVQFGHTSDNMREFISMLADWYAEGLISPDFFNYTARETRNVFQAGDCAICWDSADIITNCDNDELLLSTGFEAAGAAHSRKEAGQTLHFTPGMTSWQTSDGVCISTNCENVDMAIKFLDFMFTEPGQLLVNYGLEGISYELDENGKPQWTEAMYPTAEKTFLQSSATYLLYGLPTLEDSHANDPMTYDDRAMEALELWKTGFDGAYDYPGDLTMTAEETEEYTALINDIDTHANEYLLKWVTGAADIDATWDTYVEELNNMGLERCIEIQQTALDRYNAR